MRNRFEIKENGTDPLNGHIRPYIRTGDTFEVTADENVVIMRSIRLILATENFFSSGQKSQDKPESWTITVTHPWNRTPEKSGADRLEELLKKAGFQPEPDPTTPRD